MQDQNGNKSFTGTSLRLKIGLAEMLKGGVIMDVMNVEQARIAADPSPRQYCVRQGWLKQAGEISICLPNQVSVELNAGSKRYDSLNY